MILRYRLEKFHKHVVFQVLYMTESFRCNDRHSRDRFSINPPGNMLSIKSNDSPELSRDQVFLRGMERECDFNIVYRGLSSNEERDLYFDRVQKSLEYWANHLHAWNNNLVPGGPPIIQADINDTAIPGKNRCFALMLT